MAVCISVWEFSNDFVVVSVVDVVVIVLAFYLDTTIM